LDKEAPETPAGEQPSQPGQQRSIGRLECRTADLPAEHGYLATEHDHLDDQVLAVEPREPDQLANAEEQEVEEPERHDAMLAALAFGHELQVNKRGRDSRHRHVE
jgi:hypothetical protein